MNEKRDMVGKMNTDFEVGMYNITNNSGNKVVIF